MRVRTWIKGILAHPSDMPWYGVIQWWEIRRLLYIAIMLPVGLVTVAATYRLSSIGVPPVPVPNDTVERFTPLYAILVIVGGGIMASACYTLGWIAELTIGLVIRRVYRGDQGKVWSAVWCLGVCGSVVLCCIPPVWLAIRLFPKFWDGSI